MKKLLCFLLCLTLIFSSFSLCFAADWSSTDQSNLYNAASRLNYNGYSAAYYLYQITSKLTTLSNTVTDIKNALFHGGHSVGYWVCEIQEWMSPIYNSIVQTPLSLSNIEGLLGHTENVDGVSVISPYLKDIYDLQNYDGNLQYFKNVGSLSRKQYQIGGNSNTPSFPLNSASIEGHLLSFLFALNNSFVNYAVDTWNNFQHLTTGYNTQQSALSWTDLNSQYTFTPTSTTDGVYKWFATLHAPVARLSYVLASDERIEAQEASAANEEAVVDNFIDSNGDGAASPSDIGSVSGLSSGYKQNFGSDASPSGIFDIFNSDHATWFSQETKNQLDTTTPLRMKKGSASETPLLDKQIEDIYNALGVKQP